MIYFEWILLVSIIVIAVFSIEVKDLLSAVILMGVSSLLVSFVFLLLHAPDVALSEALIGAALTMAIYVIAVKKTERREE